MSTSTRNVSRTGKAARLALAASAAALFATTVASPAFASDAKDSSQVKCMGINACKGQTKCKTASNACAGQNSCKGMGWLLSPSAEECMKQGGKVIK
jgi:uncharacterized membrane protein